MQKLLVSVFITLSIFAQDAPKNVQILAGETPLQLQRNMNLMRAALGVHCDYCHVNSEEKGWNFALDEKATKRRAREMIKMVMDINGKHFGGQPVVTCNTCHNGNRRPAITVALPTPAPEFPTPIADRSKWPSAKDVVAKYVAAVGHEPSVSATTRVFKGTRISWDGKSAPFEVAQDGANIRMTWSAPDGTPITQTLAGEGGWIRDHDGVR
ncbi:MAG TPA: c-type cytochrome, partial [Thermoanaerobaculia bacterium]|nr:c-type cytochrome [Thermoanaerobaculia bacterium]